MKSCFYAIVFLLLASCTTLEKVKIPEGAKQNEIAILRFYRTNTAFHALNPEKPFFYVGDVLVAQLGAGNEKTVSVPAGQHRLSVRQPIMFTPSYESDNFTFDFQGGQEYYIRYSMDYDGAVSTGATVAAVGKSNFKVTDKEHYLNRQ